MCTLRRRRESAPGSALLCARCERQRRFLPRHALRSPRRSSSRARPQRSWSRHHPPPHAHAIPPHLPQRTRLPPRPLLLFAPPTPKAPWGHLLKIALGDQIELIGHLELRCDELHRVPRLRHVRIDHSHFKHLVGNPDGCDLIVLRGVLGDILEHFSGNPIPREVASFHAVIFTFEL